MMHPQLSLESERLRILTRTKSFDEDRDNLGASLLMTLLNPIPMTFFHAKCV